jgi:hypothetical protein
MTARNSEGSGLSDKELFGEIIGLNMFEYKTCMNNQNNNSGSVELLV